MQLKRIPIKSSKLATVNQHAVNLEQYSGCFVRLRPTAEATDEEIKTLKGKLIEAGAIAVRTVPRPPGDKLQLSDRALIVQDLVVGDETVPEIRELMSAMVEKSTSKHKSEVNKLLGLLADEVGL